MRGVSITAVVSSAVEPFTTSCCSRISALTLPVCMLRDTIFPLLPAGASVGDTVVKDTDAKVLEATELGSTGCTTTGHLRCTLDVGESWRLLALETKRGDR